MSALARLLYGLAPRLAGLAWVALVFAVVVMLFGTLLQIPEWVQDISPFHHLALVPAEDFRWAAAGRCCAWSRPPRARWGRRCSAVETSRCARFRAMDGSGWQPEPGWQRLPGAGPATLGVWAATIGGRDGRRQAAARPDPHDAPGVRNPHDVNYWRRAADVALSGVVADAPGLREAPVVRVEEDDDGMTLVHERVETQDAPGLWLAACLGRFAAAELGTHAWLARDQLRSRLALVERRGGWRTLARTPMADVADHLWAHRPPGSTAATRCPGWPSTVTRPWPTSPDAAPTARSPSTGRTWALGPVGADLGYLSLAAREDLEPLVAAYTDALPPGFAARDDVLTGARVMAVYTALTRLDWALARVADGEGALAGKFRHPSVAPYIFAMQRQVNQIEALLG